MSADHGTEKPKKSLNAKLLGIAGAILALIVFLYFAGATVPMGIRALGGGVNDTGSALTELGNFGHNLAHGFRSFFSGFRATVMEILRGVFFIAIIAFIGMFIAKTLKGEGKKDGGHSKDAAHH